jgi:hypothetical protein
MPTDPIQFPALDNGMITHLPVDLLIEKITRSTRFPDGSVLYAAAEAKVRYLWTLRYENLNDAEWQRFNSFVQTTRRGSASFAFFDPIGNLLASSVNLQSSAWIASPGLTVDTIADPDFENSYILTNPTGQPLSLSQTVGVAGSYSTCFSIYAKWAGSANFQMQLSSSVDSAQRSLVAASWKRHFVRLDATAAAQDRMATLTVPPTTQIIVAAPQLEIAKSPHAYLPTASSGGVFPLAWLAQDRFTTQSNAPGAHSITLQIESLRNQ